MKKMRITLYDEKNKIISDRLVDSMTEFYAGPKIKHKGPIRLDIYLKDSDKIDRVKNYLDQLKGIIPMKMRSNAGRPSNNHATNYDELLHEALTKCHDQPKLINFLRNIGFKFRTTQFIQDFKVPIRIKNRHKKYQFMVKLIKESTNDPQLDKYDFKLIFGFKLLGDKKSKILIYKDGKYKTFKKLKWPDKIKSRGDFKLKHKKDIE